jgi:membrane protein DedA with SNARE-associated domain
VRGRTCKLRVVVHVTETHVIESLVTFAEGLPYVGILVLTFLVAYIENIFPPSPSDLILVFIGTLCGIGTVDLTATLTVATLGSTTGFLTAYTIGKRFGRSMIEKGWLPFVTMPLLDKVEVWFDKYHEWIIVANRFLSGTRAVISFAAGMTKMPLMRTTILSTISALAWNAILLIVGMQVGSNWREVDSFLSSYGWGVLAAIVLGISVWLFVKRRRRSTGSPPEEPL